MVDFLLCRPHGDRFERSLVWRPWRCPARNDAGRVEHLPRDRVDIDLAAERQFLGQCLACKPDVEWIKWPVRRGIALVVAHAAPKRLCAAATAFFISSSLSRSAA